MKKQKFSIYVDETGNINHPNDGQPFGVATLTIQNGTNHNRLEENIRELGLEGFRASKHLRKYEYRIRNKVKLIMSALNGIREYNLSAHIETNPQFLLDVDKAVLARNVLPEDFLKEYNELNFQRQNFIVQSSLRQPLLSLFGSKPLTNKIFHYKFGQIGSPERHSKNLAIIAKSVSEKFNESVKLFNQRNALIGLNTNNIKFQIIDSNRHSPCFIFADLMAYCGKKLADNDPKGRWIFEEIEPYLRTNSLIQKVSPFKTILINHSVFDPKKLFTKSA